MSTFVASSTGAIMPTMRFAAFVPPVAWMGVIFWLSTGTFSAEQTASWILPLLHALFPWATPGQIEFLHWLGRKTAHVTEYAILAWLWQRAFLKSGPPGLSRGSETAAAFGLTVAYAIFDEIHQGWSGQRTASARDVALDSFGGLTALTLARRGWRRTLEGATTLLLWVAAAGGSLLLFVFFLAGAPARWLWGSVPLAWIALWGWRRHRRLDRASHGE